MNLSPRIDSVRQSVVRLWNGTADLLGLRSKPLLGVKLSGGEAKRPSRGLVWYVVLLIAAIYFVQGLRDLGSDEIPYSQFLEYLREQRVDRVWIDDDVIAGLLKPEAPGTSQRSFVTIPPANHELATALEKRGVTYTVRRGGNGLAAYIVTWFLPLVLMVALWSWIRRRSSGIGGSLSQGRSRARIQPESTPKVTFDDVAGAEDAKQELRETIEFLKNPTRMRRLGGRMPKGVLLVGTPGTGKTLLARAVSGEAGVPFISSSGSEFIEMIVGLGASRVREIFDQARQKAPCIIFIDELDAIGRSRGGPLLMGGHDEREQTLNQLLTEMDGFDPSVGVVVMAATNRPEVLDNALLRSGRFDRQIIVEKPSRDDRVDILMLHTKGMTLSAEIDLRVLAQRTPGFVGADLANIANEAAIIAVREGRDSVGMQHFEAAIDRVLAGPEKKNRILTESEKRRVAYHEAGHALVAEIVPTGEPVHKVSIIPRGGAALGYTLQLPVDEKFLSTEPELRDQLAVLMGGRTAEQLVLGSVSSGAHNDLKRAGEVARAMICELGMSSILGPLTYGKRQSAQYAAFEGVEERNYSEETARIIDAEVKALIDDAQQRAEEILRQQRSALDAVATLLHDKEVVSGEEIKRLVHESGPT